MEENFPRGGRKPKLAVKRPKSDDNLFNIAKPPKAKKSKKIKSAKETITDDSFHSSLQIRGSLTYNALKVGMKILGCIRNVHVFSLKIELPGLTFADVIINQVSDVYISSLNEKLNQNDQNDEETELGLSKIFKIGQFIPVKVVNIESKEKGVKVECTVNPKEINMGKNHRNFRKGMLVWGNVQSVADHGYEISLGVKHCRAFLPLKNIDKNTILNVGQPLWCTIHKCESSNEATILRLSSKMDHLNATKIDDIDNLDELLPGMRVEVVTEQITSTGIKGKFLNNFYGYIDRSFLKNPNDNLEKYHEGKFLTAYVLYVEPITKITHLTLRNLEPSLDASLAIGDIDSARVTSNGHNGIYLETSSKEKCFITNRRLINTLPKNKPNVNIAEMIKSKYSIGSKHSVRILDYSRMCRMYICTAEQSIVKEKLFNIEDIKPGDLIDTVIHEIKNNGIVLSFGHLKGFVSNLYISDFPYNQSVKKKFNQNQKIKARILSINENNILLTMKQSQIESDNCLTDLSQAVINEHYTGIIASNNEKGTLVVFYNGVKGWIDKHEIPTENYFYVGQVVNPWVTTVKENILFLTLQKPLQLKQIERFKMGGKLVGFVHEIHNDRVDIVDEDGNFVGIVPVNHLSSMLSLCPTFLRTLKVGDKIETLICVDNRTRPFIFSRREAVVLNRLKRFCFRDFKNLKVGNVIRCNFISSTENCIKVFPLIHGFSNNVTIPVKDVIHGDIAMPTFKYHQSVLGRITHIDTNKKLLKLTAKFSKVFPKNMEVVMEYFSSQLHDLNLVRKFGKENGWPLCQYEAGEVVKCKVEKLGENGGCLVTLTNNVKGLVPPKLCPEKIRTGQTFNATFLSQDFNNNYVEVCLSQEIRGKINPKQDGNVNLSNIHSCFARTILIKDEYLIGVLKGKQLVYVPLYLNENDFIGQKDHYSVQQFKLCVCGKVENCLIGFSKKLFLRLDKQRSKHDKITKKKNDGEVKLVSVKKVDFPEKNDNSEDEEAQDFEEEELSENDHEEELSENDHEEELLENDHEEELLENDHEEELSENDHEEELLENDHEEELSENDHEEELSENDHEEELSENDHEEELLENEHEENDEKELEMNKPDIKVVPKIQLEGMDSFFKEVNQEDESSDDEETTEKETVKKKRKLNRTERTELALQEEERLSKIEKELADPAEEPTSAEQFDRLLLANPDSSELWTKYMSFYIACTEFDKARAVGKRALSTINMTLTNEKLNIWIALLNLENMFGTNEQFEKILGEAVKFNDPLEIYLSVIQMLANSGKISEMEEKIKKVKNKHKQNSKMWLEVAKTYYMIGKFKEARNLKDSCLKSIQDKKTQLEMIIRFAIMEFKYGDEDRGSAIFETILNTSWRKVNIWTTYVDQLIKKDRIDQAREVLSRALSLQLPLKSMKSLFLKARTVEERHGNEESLEKVKENAKEYFLRFSNKLNN